MYVLTNGSYYYNKTNTSKIVKVQNINDAYRFENKDKAEIELNRASAKLKNFIIKELKDSDKHSQKNCKRKSFSPEVRKQIYRKSNGFCCLCGEFVDYEDYTVDHIVPLAKGGTNDISNLQCTCRVCNSIKTDVLPNEFMDKITEMIVYDIRKNQSRGIANRIIAKLLTSKLHNKLK